MVNLISIPASVSLGGGFSGWLCYTEPSLQSAITPGDQNGGTKVGEMTTVPRNVHTRFLRDGGARKLAEQLREGGPGVWQRSLADDLVGDIQYADVMCPITETQAEGKTAHDGTKWKRETE